MLTFAPSQVATTCIWSPTTAGDVVVATLLPPLSSVAVLRVRAAYSSPTKASKQLRLLLSGPTFTMRLSVEPVMADGSSHASRVQALESLTAVMNFVNGSPLLR